MRLNKGVDSDGFILNQIDLNQIVDPWKSLLDDTINCLKDIFKENLHSIYIYGSVGKGKAVEYHSDIDLTVILFSKTTQNDKRKCNTLNKHLSSKYPFTREVGFDLGSLENVLDKEKIYSWGFWIKSCCKCVWGIDLSREFEKFKPSIKIGKAMNGDLQAWLKSYSDIIRKSNNSSSTELYCQQIMRKIVRTGFSLIMHKEMCWVDDLDDCLFYFSKYYPDKSSDMKHALQLARNPISNKKQLLLSIQRFHWLAIEVNQRFI